MRNVYTILLILFCYFSIQAQDIFDASRNGDLTSIKDLSEINPDTVNALNSSSHSPLILAAYSGRDEAVNLLLELGANVNYEFNQGTALHGAAFKGHQAIVESLLAHGAGVNIADDNGSTALMYAILAGHISTATLLYKNGADPYQQDKTGSSAFSYAQSLNHSSLLTLFKSD